MAVPLPLARLLATRRPPAGLPAALRLRAAQVLALRRRKLGRPHRMAFAPLLWKPTPSALCHRRLLSQALPALGLEAFPPFARVRRLSALSPCRSPSSAGLLRLLQSQALSALHWSRRWVVTGLLLGRAPLPAHRPSGLRGRRNELLVVVILVVDADPRCHSAYVGRHARLTCVPSCQTRLLRVHLVLPARLALQPRPVLARRQVQRHPRIARDPPISRKRFLPACARCACSW